MEQKQTVEVLKALADDTRLAIVRNLAQANQPVTSCDIVCACASLESLSQPAASHHFAKLVKALSAKFQYVIFDAPPVGTFIDAAEIASLTDGALFVVREDFTKREEALNAIAQLKKSEKVKLIGTVMNYCETETSEYYYSYYTKDGKKVKKGSDDQGTSKKGIFTNRANV